MNEQNNTKQGYDDSRMQDYRDKRITPTLEFYDQDKDPLYLEWLEKESGYKNPLFNYGDKTPF